MPANVTSWDAHTGTQLHNCMKVYKYTLTLTYKYKYTITVELRRQIHNFKDAPHISPSQGATPTQSCRKLLIAHTQTPKPRLPAMTHLLSKSALHLFS